MQMSFKSIKSFLTQGLSAGWLLTNLPIRFAHILNLFGGTDE
jgi:hypothetical protein